jgi:alpha-glucosidase (family GH31 glycosyl hydrolase)
VAIEPLRLRLSVGDRTLLASLEGAHFPALARDEGGWWLGFALDTGVPIHGLGEKFGPLDRRGQLVVSVNHADPGVGSDRSAKNVPFLWSPRGWGLFVHTRGRTVHGIGYSQWSHRAHLLRVEDERLDLFFLAAASPAEMLERFTALTGRLGPQPLWSLGAWIATDDAAEAAPAWRKADMAADVISGAAGDGFRGYGTDGDAIELRGADLAQPDALLARAGERVSTRAVWSRAAWTGSQQYALPCGGDAEADWEGLAAAVRGALSWSLSGGGAQASEVMSPAEDVPAAYELWLRWLQFAVLGSHLRLWDGPAAPWRVDPGAHAVAKEWLSLRMRLLPYIEGCIAEARRSGLPVRRPMALAFPKDPAAHPFDTQYMLGPALLVAPVLQPGGQTRVYLPEGLWHDIWTNRFFPGERTISVTAPVEYIPVFGRDGHSLPLGPAVQHTGLLDPANRFDELWLFSLPTRAPLLAEPFTGDNAPLFVGNWDRAMMGNLPPQVRMREIGDVVAAQSPQGWVFTRRFGGPGKTPG